MDTVLLTFDKIFTSNFTNNYCYYGRTDIHYITDMTILMRLVLHTQEHHLGKYIDSCSIEKINKVNSKGWSAPEQILQQFTS
jgi:hypothetical protein